MVVAEPPVRVAPPRPDPALVEVLSTRLRVDETVEAEDFEAELSLPLRVCEIKWWRGYVKSRFYVDVDGVVESPAFRSLRSDEPDRNEAAVAAHAGLVERLIAASWETHGHGEHWFSDRFRKR